MLYRFKECLSCKQILLSTSDNLLFRGVTKSSAEHDLAQNRLHLSRAIIHDSDTQECEIFMTDEERRSHFKHLGLGGDLLTSADYQTKRFFESAEKLYAGMVYICSWSFSKKAALEFPHSLGDRALLQITQKDLIQCLLSCFARWNGKQPGESQMIHSDGSFCQDWSPQVVRYAYGRMDYPVTAECSTVLPSRLNRALRLPRGSVYGDLQEEQEWRIALDLSEVPSSIQTTRMVDTSLLSGDLGAISSETGSNDLEPMISLHGSTGLWLNDFNLNDAESFHFQSV